MGATDKKRALRGQVAPPTDLEDFDDPEDLGDPDELDRGPQELSGDEDDGLDALDSLPLPPHCEEDEASGDWIYSLQHPLEDGSRTPNKIRIPKAIYAKNVRDASRGKTEAETIFYMLASCAKVPPRVLDKISAIDYMILASLMNRRALGNSRAVLAALASEDR